VDRYSDADILAIVDNADSKGMLPSDWSTYTRSQIENLFQRGTLFAWHLYLESKLVFPPDKKGTIDTIGPPSTYNCALEEIRELTAVATDAVREIRNGTNSPVYEHGLLFVTARDIAMAASKKIMGRFDFSRYAPLHLKKAVVPFSRKEYEFIMACRRATNRGTHVSLDPSMQLQLRDKLDPFLEWCNLIIGLILQ
jgi:hypothetical protein